LSKIFSSPEPTASKREITLRSDIAVSALAELNPLTKNDEPIDRNAEMEKKV
jgi:hypothetical protein